MQDGNDQNDWVNLIFDAATRVRGNLNPSLISKKTRGRQLDIKEIGDEQANDGRRI